MTKVGPKRQNSELWASPEVKVLNSRTAAVLMLLLVIFSFVPSAAGAKKARYVRRIPPRPEIISTEPDADIYVPYENVAELIDPSQKAILMDRNEFEELLAQARASTEEADTLQLGQVSRAEYSATVSGETLTITGRLELISMSELPIAVPLTFAQMGLSSVTLDEKPAPLGYDSHGRLTVILTSKGLHRLKVSATAKLKELTTGGMQFSMSIPAAVAGKFVLKAPGDLEIHSSVPSSKPAYDKQEDQTTTSLTIGGHQSLAVVLLGNGRREDDRAILLAESAATVTLAKVHQTLSCLYTVQALRRGVRELQFELPAEWTITEVICPSLVRWSVRAAHTPQQNQTLTVRLRSAKVGTTPLHIRATAPRSGPTWRSPRMVLVDAAYQRGYFSVTTDEELRVQRENLTNARREDSLKTFVPGIVRTSAGRLYSHWGDNWSVDLELATLALRQSVKERQFFRISPEELTLTADFEVTAIDRELFDASLVLPGKSELWHITDIYVNDQKTGFEYRIEDQTDKRLLRIELAQPVLPEKVLNVKIILRNVPANWQWAADTPDRTLTIPLIRTQAQTVSGNVAFSAVGDLDAAPTYLPTVLKEVPAGQMASLQLPGNVQHAYSYKTAAEGNIQLKVSRRQTRIAAEAVGLISARPQGVTGNWRITYTISRASAKKLYLLAEKALGQELSITSPSVHIASRNIVQPDRQTLPLPRNLSDRYNLWLLNLDRSGLGRVIIEVGYERPLAERDFEVPLIRPICRGHSQNLTKSISTNPGSINELLAVQASEELALTIDAAGVKEIDAIELPPLPAPANRILAAYRLDPPSTAAGSAVALTLKTTVHKNYAVPSTLAVSSHLTTHVDPQGRQQTEAVFNVSNAGQQFLTFRLPEDAQLWSLQVAGSQVKPQRDVQGDYQVPIAKSRTPIPIRIVYACHPRKASMDTLQLVGVEIPGVEINQVGWTVFPPPGYTVTPRETNMQTTGVPQLVPAYAQLYNLIVENMFTGSVMLARAGKTAGPSLGTTDKASVALRQRVSFEREPAAAGEGKYKKGPVLSLPKWKGGLQTVDEGEPESVISTYTARRTPAPLRLVQEGRFTLPVDLIPAAGAGTRAVFNGLGTPELIVQLTAQQRQDGRCLLGFILVIAIGIASALRNARAKAVIIVAVLAIASLLAIWWPATTYFANGAFAAGLCLILLYLLVFLLRWLWPKLRFGPMPTARAVASVVLVLFALTIALSPQSARAETKERGLPPAIFLYDVDSAEAKKSQKVLIPYSRFVKLWNQANPQDPIDGLEPGTDLSLADVRYHVTVENKQLKLKLTADVTTYGKDWVVIALPTKGLAVTDVTVDGQPAEWQGIGDSMDVRSGKSNTATRTVLMLPGGTSGRLQLDALATPRFFGRKGDVKFSVPPLPAAVMTVVLPAPDLELEVDEVEGTPTSRTINGRVEWIVPLGMARDISLRWSPKVGAGAGDRTLSAVSDHEVHVFHWATLGVSRINYSFSAGEHDRFELYVPAGATLTDLQGANIRDYRRVGDRTIENHSFDVIQVRLHRPAKKRYELTARWLTSLATLDKPVRLFLVRAGDVGRESGTVTLHAAGGIGVKVIEVSGGRREAIGRRRSGTEAANNTTPVAKFYWPYRPFVLSVQLSRPPVRAQASLDQLVRVDRDQVQLLVEAAFKAEEGVLFGANLALPRGYELLSAVGADVERFFERSADTAGFVHIKFRSAVKETKIALVLMRNDVSAASPEASDSSTQLNLVDFHVPTITAVDAQGNILPKQSGRIAVQVAKSLEAQSISSENLRSIAPWALKDWLDRTQVDAVQFAYSYEVPTPSLRLSIRPLPTRLQVETFASLLVTTSSALYTYRLRYDISGSPIDHLRLQMPTEYAPLVAVESPAMRSVSKSDAGAGQTQWDIALASEVTGTVDVTVNFAIPIDETTNVLTVPRVQTDAPDGYHGIIAVQNISRHKISISKIANLEELPVSEQRRLLSKQMAKSLQYVYHSYEDNWALGLDFAAAEPASRIQAVVDLLAITTVIDRSGHCRYEAKIALQNRSEQFLRINVPQGLNLWSAKVASQPVKPVLADDSPKNQVLIPLVKTSPGGLPYDVHLYFADKADKPLVRPIDGITRLKPPAISIVDIPVTQTTWSLRLPAGYHYVRPGGNMSRVAGTVEVLSLGIEAKLEQLKRLDKAYRDVSGSATQTEEIARWNWDIFNKKLGADIANAQRYLETNRRELSREDYERLRSKLSRQSTVQDTVIVGNTAYVRKLQEQSISNMNVWLNDNAANPGLAEGMRNSFLMKKPNFVAENETRQMARLKEELAASQQQKAQWRTGLDLNYPHGAAEDGRVPELGDLPVVRSGSVISYDEAASKAEEVKGILDQLSEESAEQIDRQQQQLKAQMSQIEDNRMRRAFQMQAGSASPRPPAMPKAPKEGVTAESEFVPRFVGTPRGVRKVTGDKTGVPHAGKIPGTLAPGETDAYVTAVIAEEPDVGAAYVATGTYSLPVTLPAGQVRLDFARPMGDAELSIWAIPSRASRKLYTGLIVIIALLAALALIRIWPAPAARQPMSLNRIIIYGVVLVALALVLGLLGLLISIAAIVLIETARAVCASRPAAA